jgi:hypothetical protein
MKNPPERSGGKKGFFVKLYGKWQILIEKCMGCISVDGFHRTPLRPTARPSIPMESYEC